MAADADLIAGGVLIEIKTALGTRRTDGTRQAGLPRQHLRQLVGYVLHDLDDDFRLHPVGLYQARYATLTIWPLQQLLPRIAGRPVDLTAERERHRQAVDLPVTALAHGRVQPFPLTAPRDQPVAWLTRPPALPLNAAVPTSRATPSRTAHPCIAMPRAA